MPIRYGWRPGDAALLSKMHAAITGGRKETYAGALTAREFITKSRSGSALGFGGIVADVAGPSIEPLRSARHRDFPFLGTEQLLGFVHDGGNQPLTLGT